MMIRRFSLGLFLTLSFSAHLVATTIVDFHAGTLATAKEKAAQEGKLYFVEFTASWCMPCRWMDETTFTDPQLAAYANQNYVPVKVDIDNFDGYAYKQTYNVKVLPTILIFNSKGKLLARHAESLPPSKMLKILKSHDTAANRVKSAAKPNTSTKPSATKPSTNSGKTPPVISRPPLTPQTSTDAGPLPTANIANPVSPQGSGLYRFSVQKQISEGFSVQVGAYGEYGNVLREVEKFERQFSQPVLVHIATLNGKTVYKILIGAFTNRERAMNQQKKMKQAGVEGIIKDLGTMK